MMTHDDRGEGGVKNYQNGGDVICGCPQGISAAALDDRLKIGFCEFQFIKNAFDIT